jgi:hypothetical protein
VRKQVVSCRRRCNTRHKTRQVGIPIENVFGPAFKLFQNKRSLFEHSSWATTFRPFRPNGPFRPTCSQKESTCDVEQPIHSNQLRTNKPWASVVIPWVAFARCVPQNISTWTNTPRKLFHRHPGPTSPRRRVLATRLAGGAWRVLKRGCDSPDAAPVFPTVSVN